MIDELEIYVWPVESYKRYESLHSGKDVDGENWVTENKFIGEVNEVTYPTKFIVLPIKVVHVTTVDC